ncbi:MAG: hypothetical protein ACPMAQ_16365 [Phycisphaerae bacterium]
MASALLLGVCAAIGAAGCADPRAQEPLARHEQYLRGTAQVLREDEACRPGRLKESVDAVMARSKEDPDRLTQAVNGTGELIEAEKRRWQERQPEYRQAIEQELRGNPQRAADILPEMVY